MEMVRNAPMQMYFGGRGDKRYRVMDWRLGKERNESRMKPCFLAPTTERETADASEGEQWHWKEEARFQVRPTDVSEALRDWLEHV